MLLPVSVFVKSDKKQANFRVLNIKNETTAMIFLDFRKAFDCVGDTLLIKS